MTNSTDPLQVPANEPDEWTFEAHRMVAQTAMITVLANSEAEARVAYEALKTAPDTVWKDSNSAVFYRDPTLITSDVPSDDEGWFDVDAYKTKEDYEDGRYPETVDGFMHEADALAEANHSHYNDYYQVVITAFGNHPQYERGEPIYRRFERD